MYRSLIFLPIVLLFFQLSVAPLLKTLPSNSSSRPLRIPTSNASYFSIPIPHASIRTPQHALSYELFVYHPNCSKACQQKAVRRLQTQFNCTEIKDIPLFGYVQARCDGSLQLTPQEIANIAAHKIDGIMAYENNLRLPSPSEGEVVDLKSISNFSSSAVRVVSENYLRLQETTPSWALDRIDQKEGLDTKFDLSCFPNMGAGVTIFVLDSGCRHTHQDFSSRTSVAAVGRYRTAEDSHGHGTHIAGIAAGTQYGVCKRCQLVCVKTLDEHNKGTLIDVIDSVEYVLEQKEMNPTVPAVAVLSLGGALTTKVLDRAVEKMSKAGIFPAIAAGNADSDSCKWSPARAPESITVGATKKDDTVRETSNKGKCVNLMAPGQDIKSASHFGDTFYVQMSGTSMAAPFVAGVAALFLGEDPSLSKAQIVKAMKLGGRQIFDSRFNLTYPMLRIQHRACQQYNFPNSGARNSLPGKGTEHSQSSNYSSNYSPAEIETPFWHSPYSGSGSVSITITPSSTNVPKSSSGNHYSSDLFETNSSQPPDTQYTSSPYSSPLFLSSPSPSLPRLSLGRTTLTPSQTPSPSTIFSKSATVRRSHGPLTISPSPRKTVIQLKPPKKATNSFSITAEASSSNSIGTTNSVMETNPTFTLQSIPSPNPSTPPSPSPLYFRSVSLPITNRRDT